MKQFANQVERLTEEFGEFKKIVEAAHMEYDATRHFLLS